MKDTAIGWCHHTINFWIGCNKVNEHECAGCYAREMMEGYGENFEILRLTQGPWLEAELLNAGAKARNAFELVFTCSMSDFFHVQADPWREEAWDVIRRCTNLIWLVLTKRPERIADCLPKDWDAGRGFPNVWLGVTCGTPETFGRIDLLRNIPCALRFLSCEPLIRDIGDINLEGIGWILCGGMSGVGFSKKYPMDIKWAASLYEAAKRAGVPFLFKQISHKKPEQGINALGLYLAYREEWSAGPDSVDCVRQYPSIDGFPIASTGIKGTRLSKPEWEKYLKPLNPMGRRRRNVGNVDSPESGMPVHIGGKDSEVSTSVS
jgi:protein gp37